MLHYYPRPAAWCGAWLGLTAAAVALHQACWRGGADGVWIDLLRPLSNGLHLSALPGWIVTSRIPHLGFTASWPEAALAFGVSFGGYLLAFGLGLRIRRRLLRGGLEVSGERVTAPASPMPTGPALTRRRFLVDAPCAAAALGGAGVLSKGSLLDPWDLCIARHVVTVSGLPRTLDGLRLVQLSDTHLGPRIPASFVRRAVDLAIALAPDAFVLTGDYIHNGGRYIDQAADLFRPLVETGAPVAAVLGNHDWYGDGLGVAAALTDRGITMLDNQRVFLTGERRVTREPIGEALCLAGFGDLLEDRVDPAAALAGVDPDMPRAVLSHNPDAAELAHVAGAGAPRVDLMLSGHTHGGQVRLPLVGSPIVPSRYGQKYAGGLVRGPAFPVVVSRGIGMSVLPVRFGVPPEVVEVTLVRG